MKKINAQAGRIFQKLIEGMNGADHQRLQAGGGSMMPLVIERLHTVPAGTIYSLSHYGEMNGDLMADPDMTFLRPSEARNDFYPLSFRNDYMGVDRQAVTWGDDGKLKSFYVREQRDEATFAGQWLVNIRDQGYKPEATKEVPADTLIQADGGTINPEDYAGEARMALAEEVN